MDLCISILSSLQARIKEKLQYDDLYETDNSRSMNLRLSRMERYLHGPTTVISSRYTSSEDVIEATSAVSEEINHWNPDLSNVSMYLYPCNLCLWLGIQFILASVHPSIPNILFP